jgi:hypothetical protein
MPKELKFTKGYNQDELNQWWAETGLPGQALTIPDWLKGKTIGRGRDSWGIYDMSNGDWKNRQTAKDIGPEKQKEMAAFRNNLSSFTDPFRKQTGISKIAGTVLDIAGMALPPLGYMRMAADAANMALQKTPQERIENALATGTFTGGGAGVAGASAGAPVTGGALTPAGVAPPSSPALPARERAAYTGNIHRYGMGPEHKFYQTPGAATTAVAPPDRIPVPLAGGGWLDAIGKIFPKAAPWIAKASPYVDKATKAYKLAKTAYGVGKATGLIGGKSSSKGKSSNSILNELAARIAGGSGVGAPGTVGTEIRAMPTFNRQQVAYAGDPHRYGMGPEHNFFENTPAVAAPQIGVAPPVRVPMNSGGALNDVRTFHGKGSAHSGTIPQFVSGGTAAGGREDNIDAKLSENEYVIDAETVALLGDGSPEAGAKKLDTMRKQIRSHKGKALANGKISPNAKDSPLAYLAKGGKVGTLSKAGKAYGKSVQKVIDAGEFEFKKDTEVHFLNRKTMSLNSMLVSAKSKDEARQLVKDKHGDVEILAFSHPGVLDEVMAKHPDLNETGRANLAARKAKKKFAKGGGVLSQVAKMMKMKPRVDPNAGLKKIRDDLDKALVRPPRPIPHTPTAEELEADVEQLRKEVGPQGGSTTPLVPKKAKGGRL